MDGVNHSQFSISCLLGASPPGPRGSPSPFDPSARAPARRAALTPHISQSTSSYFVDLGGSGEARAHQMCGG
eukprot:5691256-Prymnesium_polylepis.1